MDLSRLAVSEVVKELTPLVMRVETGGFRGLLCRGCNIALGHLYDDRVRLVGLLNYLDSYGPTCVTKGLR